MAWTLSAFADEAADSADGQIGALRSAKIDRIDLRMIDGINIVELPVNQAQRVKQKLDEVGIRVGMYGSPIGKTGVVDPLETELARLDHLAVMREVFGATSVRVFSFYNHTGVETMRWKEMAFDRLGKLIEHAKSLGLVLYHENETGVYGDHPDRVRELAELRGDHFKLIYDFANYLRTGTEPRAGWQLLKQVTDALHFKDQKHGGDHTPIGLGDTMAREILEDAVASGWSGPCTLEPHLFMSDAVLATHVHGRGDTSLAGKSRQELFQVAAEHAHGLLASVGVM